MKNRIFTILLAAAMIGGALQTNAAWSPADGPLMSKWADDVDPNNVLPEYPRPTMVRAQWLNLNGLWDYAVLPREAGKPSEFEGEILVPFAIESALSGVMKRVTKDDRIWYQREFTIPEAWTGDRILLHFGAVDWDTTVEVNGVTIGSHQGGYDKFSFDITEALNDSGTQTLVVSVWDPTNDGMQARGKQDSSPRGIWYTPISGIWQTVWLEPVPMTSIDRLKILPDIDKQSVSIDTSILGDGAGVTITATASDASGTIVGVGSAPAGSPLTIALADSQLWTPESPTLYSLQIDARRGTTRLDSVDSYFAMRKISIGPDEDGVLRLLLNDKPVFQYGPLDQGFWPDGLYTPPTDEALRFDIEITKAMGFNMARKHIKVEPERWYYYCDLLGLLVWQDMPSGGAYGQDGGDRTEADRAQYELEQKRMIDNLYNHPSIIMWVPFNEGWGQYDTVRITEWVKNYDPSRLVNNASGWTDHGVGDVVDMHNYPGPGMPDLEENRAAVLGEFGGLGLPVSGHTWQDEANWGYRSYETPEALTDAYLNLLKKLHRLIGQGLAAAVYTQTTDVEIEVNGLLTYDREVMKLPLETLRAANLNLHTPPPPPPVINVVLPTSEKRAQEWRFTNTQPADDWKSPSFDDSDWSPGEGGFGTAHTPNSIVVTHWETPDIWIRRTFEVEGDLPVNPQLRVNHDEDAEVYVNGVLVGEFKAWENAYENYPGNGALRDALKKGTNTIAVHCRQTGGGQFIDVGIVDVIEP